MTMQARGAIGRYRLDGLAGEGATAQVWRATDTRLDRTVALKVLRPEIAADPVVVERFFREAHAMADLADPAIVQIFDMIAEDDRHALVMEYAGGPSLAQILGGGNVLEPARAVAIARSVTRALGAAHARGIIHRDVKPANILTTTGGDVKVTDFGLAKAFAQPDGGATLAGGLVGSAHYLAPEQAQGFPLTPASDFYSLGVVLHEMLTGAVPFSEDSAIATALAHVRKPAPSIKVLSASMSPALARVVHRLLAKNPSDRYGNAAELDAALAAALRSPAPVSATDAFGTLFAGLRARVPVRSAAILAAVLVALGIAAALATAVRPPVSHQSNLALAASSAPRLVSVPRITGMALSSAYATLDRLALNSKISARESVEPLDSVLAQTPAAGTRVRRGADVAVVISAGLPAPSSAVEAAAIALPRGHGFHHGHGHHGHHDD
jgi:serine/threonine-protein kinase